METNDTDVLLAIKCSRYAIWCSKKKALSSLAVFPLEYSCLYMSIQCSNLSMRISNRYCLRNSIFTSIIFLLCTFKGNQKLINISTWWLTGPGVVDRSLLNQLYSWNFNWELSSPVCIISPCWWSKAVYWMLLACWTHTLVEMVFQGLCKDLKKMQALRLSGFIRCRKFKYSLLQRWGCQGLVDDKPFKCIWSSSTLVGGTGLDGPCVNLTTRTTVMP